MECDQQKWKPVLRFGRATTKKTTAVNSLQFRQKESAGAQ
jgi:hypothetical protein